MRKTGRPPVSGAAGLLVLCLAGRAAAQGADAAGGDAVSRPTVVEKSAAAGSFLSLAQASAVDSRSAAALGFGGYDGARGTALFEASAEVRVWGPVALRGGAVYTVEDQRLRPSFGGRVQLLREGRHGLDGSVGAFYRPEGLTEPEGEIEAVLAAGTHLGGTYLIGNLLYGQDPEGRERDGEVRLAAVRPVAARLMLGFDGRLRFDLGSDAAVKAAAGEPTLDALVGPAATVLLGPVALLLHGGASAVRNQGANTYGVFLLGGVGTAF
jgi:hypothetical protein